MKLSDSRGIKTPLWYTNELLREDDINSIGQMNYQLVVDKYSAMLASRSSGVAYVVGGVDIHWSTACTVVLKSGIAVSKTGAYLESDTWGFVPSVDKAFVVSVPEDALIGLTVGGALDRIDTIQIRPIENTYNSKSRNFKDPVTGLITTALVNTRKEYGYEFMVLVGTQSVTPTAPVVTPGWIKLAEVYVAAGASVLSESNIKCFTDSSLWTSSSNATVEMKSATELPNSIMVRDSLGITGVKGIRFPIVQSASSEPNVLDDYEEGTFTPVIIGMTTAGVGTYTTHTGDYTKIGNQVFFHISLVWTAHTGTGAMRVSGLPITPASGLYSASVVPNNVALVESTVLGAMVDGASIQIILYALPVGGGTIAFITLNSSGELYISGSYNV